jgi:hypothetical protein
MGRSEDASASALSARRFSVRYQGSLAWTSRCAGRKSRASRPTEQASADSEHVVHRMHKLFKLTEEAGDAETGDILIRRMQYHAGQAWMLRSYLHCVEDTAKTA